VFPVPARRPALTFRYLHSIHRETPILIPQLGPEVRLRVRVPPAAAGCVLTSIGTVHAPGFGVATAPGGAPHAFVNIIGKPARQFIQILPDLDAVASSSWVGAMSCATAGRIRMRGTHPARPGTSSSSVR
jgi:hypothetical protein